MLKLKSERKAERRRAESEIQEIRSLLDEAHRSFNTLTDPELLDACIYEINALQARHDYALRRAKAR